MQNPRLYGSYWYDSTLGLYFMKTRMYDPELGRFMSKDQVSGGGGSALDFNPYLYCNNNPISRIDPNGKIAIAILAAPIQIIAEAAAIVVVSVAVISLAYLAYEAGKAVSRALDNINYSSTDVVPNTTSGNPGNSTPGSGNGKNKNKGKNNKNSPQNKPKPKFEYKEEWKINVGRYGPEALAAKPIADILTGITKHGIERIIERSNYISPSVILNILRNPEKIIHGIDEYGRPFVQYSAQSITKTNSVQVISVFINKLGQIITLH
jgi:RHS repeat-associated protein